ncbi:MAG: cation-translocating P-type ATPase [Parasphingopyxis sp.]|uniref:cation-translocating P-type ATPase n=1 Tax=Parasphingopyxis sp. TaxID=1920299 RepID=UPI003FA08509
MPVTVANTGSPGRKGKDGPARISDRQDARWHACDADAIADIFGTDPEKGLTASEAASRLASDGPNILPEPKGKSWFRRFMTQFKDVMILVLLGAAGIAALIGEIADAALIAAILMLNAVIGFAQEVRAIRAVRALKDLVPQKSIVIRDGRRESVDATQLVPGDIAAIAAGGRIPGDMRLISVEDLEVDEAPLTGESLTRQKSAAVAADEDLALGDRTNMAFSGTLATRGSALGIVVATGTHSEIGRIASTLQGRSRPATPLQQRLARISRRIAIAAIVICASLFVTGLMIGHPPLVMLLTAASVAIAAIPEALPAVVAVLLAVGARKMARHDALIRRLPAVETLGSVTYICTDKTGTLTENRMEVAEIESDDPAELFTAMALCTDVGGADAGEKHGEPTEFAIAEFAAESGYERADLEHAKPRTRTFAFSSERKRMTTVHRTDDGYICYMKGAPEVLLASFPEGRRKAETLAASGLRVLAFARRLSASPPMIDDPQDGFEILGLVGLMDPPRAEAASAIAACRTAGITPVMITGDHPRTAETIARRIGLVSDGATVITGPELAKLGDAELMDRVLDTDIYARVDPAQKIRIVKALQNHRQFVAMTGDGVNDAPALLHANIGVAMGRIGTDVAREAADLILLDDNFASIVAAVREGRRIFDNIRKFIRYVLACNLAEILTLFVALVLGLPLPLLPLQILWINLVTDGVPGLALAGEPAEPDIMKRPPHPPSSGLFDSKMWRHIAIMGTFMAMVTIGVQMAALDAGNENWQTMVFTVLTFLQLGQAIAVRSDRRSVFLLNPLSNPALVFAIVLTVILHLAVVYSALGNALFHTAPLSAAELAICVLVSLSGLAFSELLKTLRDGFASANKRWKSRPDLR